ncbi:hypothetical protein, partial [Poseidonibacter sp.]|uniref:hypothetical protein n=1 Tax=Poseidonibacter sp. TaxID=2321188 RepID=UPI003C71CC42
MPKILTPSNYSLSTKAILAFIVFIFLFLFIKYALAIPNIKQESYNKELHNIEKNLFFIKEQMIMAIKSIRNHTNQGIRLNKEKIVSNIKDVQILAKQSNDEDLIKVLQESTISKFCSYQLRSEDKLLYKYIKDKELCYKNDMTIF